MLAVISLAVLAGCSRQPVETAAPPVAAQPTEQVLHLAQTAEPTTLDPALVQDGPTIEVLQQICNGLVQWTSANKLAPCLAERWETSADGRTYTFHLRSGVKFHNGRMLSADDFVYSIQRALLPATKSPVAAVYLNDIVGARDVLAGKSTKVAGLAAPDPRTVRITIDAPKAYFLAKLSYPTAFVLAREAIEAQGGKLDEKSLVGTGPFRLTSYRHGVRLVLEAFPEYFEGAPKLARIERAIVLDAGTRHAQFESGALDICDVTMADYEKDRTDSVLQKQLHQFDRPSIFYLALNQRAFPPFKDVRVRQAFNHAIDKDRLVKTVMLGVNRKADGILPPGVPGHDPHFQGLGFDPERARKLLADAGFPGGKNFPPLTLTFRERMPDYKRVCEVIAEMLRTNLGLDVSLRELEWGKFLAERNQGTMPLYFLRWAADYLDPQNFLSTMLHSKAPENTIGYASAEFDRLCEKADTLQNLEERLRVYRQAEERVVKDAPWVPIYYQRDIELWNPRLQGVEDSSMGHLPHRKTHFSEK
jgi:ABC-type transport system substrate-binding protein